MVQRNEANAIIQHGTMLLLNRAALEQSGGWETDTIVEDTDLGLRLLIQGYECVYINQAYGKGRLPAGFSEYKKQRFRWSYGATRTIVKFFPYLFGWKKGLNVRQKMHFLLGWLPWMGNAFHPFFVIGAIFVSWTYILSPAYVMSSAIFMPILVYVALESLASAWLYKARMKLPIGRIVLSFVAGASLVWTIGRGVLTGLVYSRYPFRVTKKARDVVSTNLGSAFPVVISLVLVGLDGALWRTYFQAVPFEVSTWMVLLLVLAFPGLACALMVRFERIHLR